VIAALSTDGIISRPRRWMTVVFPAVRLPRRLTVTGGRQGEDEGPLLVIPMVG
jgi:hypothetical protein